MRPELGHTITPNHRISTVRNKARMEEGGELMETTTSDAYPLAW